MMQGYARALLILCQLHFGWTPLAATVLCSLRVLPAISIHSQDASLEGQEGSGKARGGPLCISG